MTDWIAVAKARGLDIPESAVHHIAPSLTSLEAAFRPLLARLAPETEPAIVLSESAVIAE